MTAEPREVLRRLRGTRSLRAFAADLAAVGMHKPLTRQRLSNVELGIAELAPAEWEALADALIRIGYGADEVASLRQDTPVIEPPPMATPELRRRQWARVVELLTGNRWWQHPTSLMERVAGRERAHRYRELVERHGIDQDRQRMELMHRLDLGAAAAGLFVPNPQDRVEVGRGSVLSVSVDAVELFVLQARLHNAGPAPWENRILFRVGPPVTSSLPFSPMVLPIPDTMPGSGCEVIIPGRAQWFPNLAVITYVMVFPDCSTCLPGRLRCLIDTRRPGKFDHTLPMPPGFAAAADQ